MDTRIPDPDGRALVLYDPSLHQPNAEGIDSKRSSKKQKTVVVYDLNTSPLPEGEPPDIQSFRTNLQQFTTTCQRNSTGRHLQNEGITFTTEVIPPSLAID